jgi:uncharacterized protein (DUF433 family)
MGVPNLGWVVVVERTADGDMLIRGTRVDIATVLDAYRDGLSPEEIVYNYPTLTLEQVYATLTYYLAHKVALDAAARPAAAASEEAVLDRAFRELIASPRAGDRTGRGARR